TPLVRERRDAPARWHPAGDRGEPRSPDHLDLYRLCRVTAAEHVSARQDLVAGDDHARTEDLAIGIADAHPPWRVVVERVCSSHRRLVGANVVRHAVTPRTRSQDHRFNSIRADATMLGEPSIC